MALSLKQVGIFVVLLVLFIVLANLAFQYILPILKLNSESMIPTYHKGDVLFYKTSSSYSINDVVVYTSSILPKPIIVRIIEENPDGTFKAKGDNTKTNPSPNARLDQNNLKKEQIMGKVLFGANSFIFYLVVYGIEIMFAIILTLVISKKIKK